MVVSQHRMVDVASGGVSDISVHPSSIGTTSGEATRATGSAGAALWMISVIDKWAIGARAARVEEKGGGS